MASLSQTQKISNDGALGKRRLDRFDNVPWVYYPFVFIQWILGFAAYVIGHFLVHHTSEIVIEGREHLDEERNYIFCGWHENLYPYFNSFRRFDWPIAGFIDTHWHVAPVHWFVRRFGCRVLYKRPGEKCTNPVARMIALLNSGYSQLIFPDGPAGPAKKIHSGVLLTAQKTGVPIVPFRLETEGDFRVFWQWDKKKVSLPFGKLKVIYAEPIYVTADNWSEVKAYLDRHLG